MTALADLELKKAYHKPADDIAGAFYLPALAAATRYDRAVGFFSSGIYAIAWGSLRRFVEHGGRMRLICSPVLADDDHEALREGYSARSEAASAAAISAELSRMLASPALAKPTRVLASLVAAGIVDVRLAWVGTEAGGRPRRLFHDKVGLFSDTSGDIAFKGSMNETWSGLSQDGNLESVDVFVSWGGDRERERVADERRYFDLLWSDAWPGVTTRPLPDSARADIVSAADASAWPDLVDEISLELEHATGWSPEAGRPNGRTPRPHQVQALEAWVAAGRRGILEHATGSGKTFTALCAAHDAMRRGEVPIFLVPSELLFEQWRGELMQAFGDRGLQLLLCGAGHARWSEGGLLRTWTRPRDGEPIPRAVLSTIPTAAGTRFLSQCAQGDHLLLVADEVHRLGATRSRSVLGLETGARLGLSATPKRAGDPEGTDAILGYFNGIVPPPFGIGEAIEAGALTPYTYSVHPVPLAPDEVEAWSRITGEYRRLYARSAGDPEAASASSGRLKLLLIQRARIVKAARAKTAAATQIVLGAYRRGQRWIVYCDDQGQLGAVLSALRQAGVADAHEYHSAMAGDRSRTLDRFNAVGGILVSIKCLDEGVDIPEVTHALILASSRNPREFVQRRGRVLRRAPGKFLAHVHDVVVTPPPGDEDTSSILAGEIGRAITFGSHAINPASVTDLKRFALRAGLDWEAAAPDGFENDDGREGAPLADPPQDKEMER